ncbi:hypothetical protein MX059_09890 [Streptococcus uberis]|nr:hypothetical protein [Streptococcus uberis]
MEDSKFRMYVHELDNMTLNSLISFENAFYFLNEIEENKQDRSMPLFWYFIQTAVLYSGNVSKLLWPSYRKQKGKGGKYYFTEKHKDYINERFFLRDTLQINEDSTVKNKRLRNSFEHIDERMEEHNFSLFADKNIGFSVMNFGISGISEEEQRKKLFRFYNSETSELIFYGESIIIKNLYEDMIDIREKVISWKEHNR